MRLIDADNLLIHLNNAFCAGYIGNGYDVAEKVVNEEPTSDPETLRPTANIRHGTYKETYDDAFCSRCNVLINNSENYDAIWYNHYKYCPHCGARFVSADD